MPKRIALAPARTRLWLVALLLVLAGLGWWWTIGALGGMDEGAWTSLGPLGWFLGVWVVMMAAMMLPSAWPTVALYSRMLDGRSVLSPFLFVAGYLATWTLVGLAAFTLGRAGGNVTYGVFAWDRGGRWFAGATLLAAAAYELTPLKDACLGRCRSPFGFLVGAWQDGPIGAVRMGAKHGAWCVGCCWALMAALFALGAMSVEWMAFVAALIAFEKLIRWRRLATGATATALAVLAVVILV